MRKFTLFLAFLFFIGVNFAFAQTRTISGTVTSADNGSALPGVSVVVVGTTNGTVTDLNGKYTLTVGPNAKALSFSFVGMKKQEITIGSSNEINVVMQTQAYAVNEVVVTALGVSRQARALGYSVSSVNSTEISKTAVTDVVNALSGKVAGVQITNSSGAAGSAPFVEIRGSSSILGNNQPLYVVDGVPIESGGGDGTVDQVAYSSRTVDINPDDIASISVLKGGAATALYGMRAGNGVILITTKKGQKQNGLSINFSTSTKFEKISQVPALQNQYSQGSFYLGAYYGSSYMDPDAPYYNGASWGPALSTLRYTTDPNYVPADGATTSMADYIKYWDPNGRLVDANSSFASSKKAIAYNPYDFFQIGVAADNNVSISGGNDNTTFYTSISNHTEKGVIPLNTLNRTTFSINASHKAAKNLTFSTALNYSNTYANRKQQGSNISGVMLGLLRTPPTFNNAYGYMFTGAYRTGQERSYRNGGGYDNPYWVVNQINYADETNRLFGNFTAKWEIIKDLNLTYRSGLDYNNYYSTNNYAIHSRAYPSGYSSPLNSFTMDLNQDLFANYKINLSQDIQLTAMAGMNAYQHRYKYVQAEANGLIIPGWFNVANSSSVMGYQGENEYRTDALYYDLGLSYKNTLYLDATGRYESSTTLPEKNKAFFYPSVSLGFVFSDLGALKNSEVLSFGKLRASYAVTANIPTAYNTTTYFVQQAITDGWVQPQQINFPFMGVNGYMPNYIMGNPDLKPETAKSWSIGAHLNFWNNRLVLDGDYYHRINSDLLLNVPIAPSTGYQDRYQNAAEMKTTGFELLATVEIIKSKSVNWSITVNWSNPKSMVTKLSDGVPNVFLGGFTEPQVRAVAGQEYRSIYGLDWVRDSKGQLVINDQPGEFYGYPIPGTSQIYLGTVSPKWTAGITNNVSYKGFALNFLIDIKHGGLMWNGTLGALDYFGTSAETANRNQDYVWSGVMGHVDANGNVVTTGTVNTQKVKLDENWRFWDGYGSGFTGPSSPYIENSGWVRLRSVTLSYDFKQAVMKNVNWIKHCNLFFTGYNLWLSTPYTGIDPETSLLGASNAQGFDYFNMPGTKSYTVGLKIGF